MDFTKPQVSDTKKVFSPVLLHVFQSKVDYLLHQLKDERERNTNLLRDFKAAFELYRGEWSYIDFLSFLLSKDPKKFLIGKYLEGQNIGGIKIKEDKLEEFLEIPPYDHLLVFRSKLVGWTREKIDKYYSQKEMAFHVLPISSTETRAVTENFSVYASSEEHLQLHKDLEGFCKIYNLLQEERKIRNAEMGRQLERATKGMLIATKKKTLWGDSWERSFEIDYTYFMALEQKEFLERN